MQFSQNSVFEEVAHVERKKKGKDKNPGRKRDDEEF